MQSEICKLEYTVIHSRRKTLSIEVTAEGDVIVRAPAGFPDDKIREFIDKKQDWILSHVKTARESYQAMPSYSYDEIKNFADKASVVIPPRVRYYAGLMGITYGRITIRNQKTRWGSCSAKGNLNFNCLLVLLPDEILDYVVVHELAHRVELNHSPAFWAIVEKYIPDYKKRRKWLKDNGGQYIQRL